MCVQYGVDYAHALLTLLLHLLRRCLACKPLRAPIVPCCRNGSWVRIFGAGRATHDATKCSAAAAAAAAATLSPASIIAAVAECRCAWGRRTSRRRVVRCKHAGGSAARRAIHSFRRSAKNARQCSNICERMLCSRNCLALHLSLALLPDSP